MRKKGGSVLRGSNVAIGKYFISPECAINEIWFAVTMIPLNGPRLGGRIAIIVRRKIISLNIIDVKNIIAST